MRERPTCSDKDKRWYGFLQFLNLVLPACFNAILSVLSYSACLRADIIDTYEMIDIGIAIDTLPTSSSSSALRVTAQDRISFACLFCLVFLICFVCPPGKSLSTTTLQPPPSKPFT